MVQVLTHAELFGSLMVCGQTACVTDSVQHRPEHKIPAHLRWRTVALHWGHSMLLENTSMPTTRKCMSPRGLAALQIAIRSGTSPLDLLDLYPDTETVDPHWLTVWCLMAQNQMTSKEVANLLGIHRKSVIKIILSLDRLRRTEPRVDAWLKTAQAAIRQTDNPHSERCAL